jgi:hypothetical protein
MVVIVFTMYFYSAGDIHSDATDWNNFGNFGYKYAVGTTISPNIHGSGRTHNYNWSAG